MFFSTVQVSLMVPHMPINLLQCIIVITFFNSSFQWEKSTSVTIKDQFYYCHDSVQIDDLVSFDHCVNQRKKPHWPRGADRKYDSEREIYLKDISDHLSSLKFPQTLSSAKTLESLMTPRLLARDIYQVYGSGMKLIIVLFIIYWCFLIHANSIF